MSKTFRRVAEIETEIGCIIRVIERDKTTRRIEIDGGLDSHFVNLNAEEWDAFTDAIWHVGRPSEPELVATAESTKILMEPNSLI